MAEKVINVTPTWETAVIIYMACLENPDASEHTKQGARDDIIKLARFVDAGIEEEKAIKED